MWCKNMDHSFNLEIAIKYGQQNATFLNNIAYWTEKKMKSKTDFHEGKYWIYNSYESWSLLFPYWSISKIKRIIKSCLKNDLIVVKKFNKVKFDKTNWYSLTNKSINYYPKLKKMISSENH